MQSTAFQAQRELASSATQSIASLLNVTSPALGSSSSDSLSRVLNSVATVQLQLSALDCASVDCGGGVCALVAGVPTCNCNGTGFGGHNCDSPLTNATTTSNSSESAFVVACASASCFVSMLELLCCFTLPQRHQRDCVRLSTPRTAVGMDFV